MSEKRIHSILVIGLGKVGRLVADLLHGNGYRVRGMDLSRDKESAYEVISGDTGDSAGLLAAMKDMDAVITCLPYSLNQGIAQAAVDAGLHYFDLTEDVPTTREVRKLAKTARGIMAPQCGLAPGFISIVGAHLAHGFDKLRSIELRVGALPQHPSGLLGYAFNWSAEGVVNEYLNDSEVIRGGQRDRVPAMQSVETIVIDGVQLEAFSTSGGLGTMCETFDGRVEKLNYKTIRYPGHCHLMRFFFDELHMRSDRPRAGKILVNAKPPVNDDVVYVHAAVEGWREGALLRDEFVRSYYPKEIAGGLWKAISWTTASSVAAVVELVNRGDIPGHGFLKQETITLEKFLDTPTGANFK
jgi:saccharopine dehydrogenase (NAD+, L-lysine-forming)